MQHTMSYITNIIVKRGKMACVGKFSFSIYTGRGLNQRNKKKQKGRSVVMIWGADVLSEDGAMRGQDTCCCCVTCHISFASRRLACKYIMFSSQQGKKWSCHNADSFWWEYLWNCCIKSVSDKPSWVAACHPTTGPKFHVFWNIFQWNLFANEGILCRCCSVNCERCSLQVVWAVQKNANTNGGM